MKELLEHKHLIYELVIRDLRLRYRKPFFGFLWLLIIPFSTALIYKVLFSDFMHATSGRYPFFIHLLTALLPWTYLTSSIQAASRCILDSKNIIYQISFPKYLLPISIVLANLIMFLPTTLVLLVFLLVFQVKISALIIFLPFVILVQTFLIMGLSLLACTFEVFYRDVEYFIQILLMALFFLTPGVYTLEDLISRASPLFTEIYLLNPLVGLLNLYRIVFIGGYLGNLPKQINFLNTFIMPVLFSLGLLILGYFVFNKYESKFCDYINV